ncbi:TetR family transcriptional regulator [Actinophytocola xinjiangensis]|uniref:TetR family transcriptional regulator n=1 Tax=Actinophytocola xinjiangensis TaxID=485602 RepID=A0A7Z1AYN3_9PSEU|nr:TetR/AcrR family transcriptional regulator [Actinophytocola xinjiangensis]OLF09418.1 TetR family transcriptional regulator [Actinophytocola xinjiangensis]
MDGRVARGEQTRASVLLHAMGIASVEGLDGLSIGRLATELAVSKSGVFARFGSKEELQLATIAAAREVFVDAVVRPALAGPPGLERLWRLCSGWITYSRDRIFPGGCFFASVSAEYDARPGRVRDAVAAALAEWSALLRQAAGDALQLGQLVPAADARQLAFELSALVTAANAASVLHNDDTAYDLATTGVLDRLRGLATDPAALRR